MSITTPRLISVIGVGNDFRSDDGAGLYVARQIQKCGAPHLQTYVGVGDGTDLIHAWQNARAAFVIDSVSARGRPGTIYRFDGLKEVITDDLFGFCTTHAFSIPKTITMAGILGQMPQTLIVYGIEAKGFASGRGLSSEIIAAADEVVERIGGEIKAFSK